MTKHKSLVRTFLWTGVVCSGLITAIAVGAGTAPDHRILSGRKNLEAATRHEAKSQAAEIGERLRRGEPVSAEEQGFLNTYNRVPKPRMSVVVPPASADLQAVADKLRGMDIYQRQQAGKTITAEEQGFLNQYARRNAANRPVSSTLDADGCDCSGESFASGAVNLPIPDGTGTDSCVAVGGISSTITLPVDAGLVLDVNIGLNVQHSWLGDLVIDVTHNGITVRLKSRTLAETCDNFTGTVFDDEGEPYATYECPHTGCFTTYDSESCFGNGLLSEFDGLDAGGDWTIRIADQFPLDAGMLLDWSICVNAIPVIEACECPNPIYDSGHLRIPIPDGSATNRCDPTGGPTHTITVPAGAGTVSDVNVSVLIGHTFVGDLVISLTHAGTTVILKSNAPATYEDGCANLQTTFDDEGEQYVSGACPHYGCTRPYDIGNCLTNVLLSAFDGMPAEGDWTLTVADNFSGDAGTLYHWALCLNSPDALPVVCDACAEETFPSGILDLPIPDNAGTADCLAEGGISHTITLPPSSGHVEDVNIGVKVQHPAGYDLIMDVTHNGVTVVLKSIYGVGCQNLDVVWDDEGEMWLYGNCAHGDCYRTRMDASCPGISLLSAFDGMPAEGDWVLRIADRNADWGSGSLQEWFVCLDPAPPPVLADDCLLEGPACNSQPPLVYTSISGMIDDAVITVLEDSLQMGWTRVADAEFYQIYAGNLNGDSASYRPIATAFDTTIVFPAQLLETSPEGNAQGLFVQAKQAVRTLVGADLACWPMDEGSGDLVEDFAQDNDGTNFGAEWIPTVPGHYGLRFEHGDYVNVQNDVEYYGQPLQIIACVTIYEYPTVQTGAYYIFSSHRYAPWFQGFGLRIDVNGRLLSQVWNEETQSWNTLWAPPSRRVPLGVPFLVTAVINGDESLLLLNDEVVDGGTQEYNSITNGFHMTIGAHNYNGDRYQNHMRGDIHWLKVSQVIPETARN